MLALFMSLTFFLSLGFAQTTPWGPLQKMRGCGSTTEDPDTWVDMRKPGESMHLIPQLDQVGASLCYSYSGTTLASAFLNLNVTPEFRQKYQNDLILSPYVTSFAAQLESGNNYCNHPCTFVNFIFKHKTACSSNRAMYNAQKGIREIDQPKVVLGQCIRWEVAGYKKDIKPNIDKIIFEALSDASLNEQQRIDLVAQKLDAEFSHGFYHRLDKKKRASIAKYALNNPDNWRAALTVIAPHCAQLSTSDGKINSKFVGNVNLAEALGVSSSSIVSPADEIGSTDKEYLDKTPICEYKNMDSDYSKTSTCNIQKNVNYKPQNFIDDINAALDVPQTTPVAVDHCWAFYSSRFAPITVAESQTKNKKCYISSEKAKAAERESDPKKSSKYETGDHKVLLIGRRINPVTKECEFLMRNSIGNDCNSYYGAHDQPDTKESPNYFTRCREELENNNSADVWIPATSLGHNTHGITVLKKRK